MLKNPFSRLKNEFVFTLTLISIFIGIYLSFYTLVHGGIGWDSPGDMISAKAFLNLSGKESLNQAYELIPATSEFYGFFIYQLTDFVLKIFFNYKFDFDYQNFSNFQIISVVNFLLSFSSILFMAFVLFFISKSKIVALFFIALMQTNPIWIGMQIVNFKDTPVATGLTFLSASLLLLLNLEIKQMYYLFAGIFFTIFGILIAINSRAGSIVLVLIIYGFFNIFYLFNIYFKKNSNTFVLLLINFIILFTSLIITFKINPLFRIEPFDWIIDSINISRNFPSIQPVRTAGFELMSNDLPWWYIPSWIFAQNSIPFVILVILTIILIFNNLKSFSCNFHLLFLLIQAFFIPILFIIFNLNLYNAIRHILFYLPALYGFLIIVLLLFKPPRNFLYEKIIIIVVIFNLFDTFRWIPYSYAYINPLAGISKNKRNWDLDYWGVTSREGIKKLNLKSSYRPIYILPDGASSLPFGGIKKLDDNLLIPYSYYVFMHWNHDILKEKCNVIVEIKRDFQILGKGGICFKN